MPDYDVLILGGGHNGLVAAAYLARAGRSCLLLERREELGGAAVSQSLFPGLPARVSSYAYLVSLLPRQIVDELELRVTLARRAVSSYTPDPRVGGERGLLIDAADPAATLASFRSVTGGDADAKAWSGFYAMTRRVAEAVFPTMMRPLMAREQMRRLVGDDEAWEAVFERPLGATLAQVFSDEVVAGVVLTDALIGTFAGAMDADLRQNRCLLYHTIGRSDGAWLVPVGGMGALTAALAAAAAGAGAQLRTGAEVTAVEPQDGQVAVEIEGAQGPARLSARHLLVNAAPDELGRLLGEHHPDPAPEGSQLKVNLLLSRLPRLREEGVDPARAFAGTFHVNESVPQLERARSEAAAGRIPALVPCEAYCHSLTDRSILGTELGPDVQTLTVFALHMPARLFAADPDGSREAALEATLASLQGVLAEPLEDCLMRDGAGAPCVAVHTPLDLERDLRMPGGHIFHRDLSWPFAEQEQEVGRWGVETGHPGILLCGAGARRGGGVSGIPGRNAAMAVLAR